MHSILWNPLTGQYENNTQRETSANVVARRVTNLLNGYEFDFAQVIGPQEQARLPFNAVQVADTNL